MEKNNKLKSFAVMYLETKYDHIAQYATEQAETEAEVWDKYNKKYYPGCVVNIAEHEIIEDEE